MSENRKLTPNVSQFLFEAAEAFGRIKTDMFSQDMFCQLLENGIESPIEDLFFIACNVMCAANYVEVNPYVWGGVKGEVTEGSGIFIFPQYKIGKYRVDFLLNQNGIGPSEHLTPVVIELDGHDFHDKDKSQRAYEKSRDRYFVKSGYKVLHFTGSEVVADPYKVAFEALSLIGMMAVSGSDEYNPLNPLGIE